MPQRAIVTSLEPQMDFVSDGTVNMHFDVTYVASPDGLQYQQQVTVNMALNDTVATIGGRLSAAVIAGQPAGFNIAAGQILSPSYQKI